ncbi:MAG: malate dehydrogenase, partial [Solirubrobacteraceae bacterium]
ADGMRSMVVPTTGAYSLEEGLPCSLPVRLPSDGAYAIVEGPEITRFAQSKIDATVDELRAERAAVEQLGLV